MNGVRKTTTAAAAAMNTEVVRRLLNGSDASPKSAMQMAMQLSVSTLNTSLELEYGYQDRYCCMRNAYARNRTHADRRRMVFPIWNTGACLARSLSMTSDNETPTRNRNMGAGIPPRNWLSQNHPPPRSCGRTHPP